MASERSGTVTEAETAIRAGEPKAALALLTAGVKASPSDVKLRIFLAQLLCVLGQWERAHTQLNVAAEMDAATGPMREMVGHALRCEKLRASVFDGRRTPLIFGTPDPWLASLIESLLRSGSGEPELARSLASQAFEAAPASAGALDGTPFEWIADADARLGPVLEAMVNGKYYWIPFSRLARVDIEQPTDLRDMVWLPAQLQFSNGGEAIAMLPTRYPGSEHSDDDAIRMARLTEWRSDSASGDGEPRWFGLGQRMLVTNLGEHPLLSVRSIEFAGSADPMAAESAAVHG